MSQFLTRTLPDVGHALDVNGRMLYTSHAQITSILRSRLGPDHGALLATPDVQSDGPIDWSTSLQGAAQPVGRLSAAQRSTLEQSLHRLTRDIRGLVTRLRAEDSAASRMVALTLEKALSQPPGDWLFGVDDKPVMVLWGHGPSIAPESSADHVLPTSAGVEGRAEQPPPAPTAALSAEETGTASAVAPHATSRTRWMWLFVALAVLLTVWALTKCSVSRNSAAGLDQQIAEVERRNAELESELKQKATQAPVNCVPSAAPAASEPEATPPAPPASVPPAVPAPAPKPKASAPAPAKLLPRLTIPPGALERGDLSFLEGDWQIGGRKGTYYDQGTGEDVGTVDQTVLRFEKDGSGARYDKDRTWHGEPAPDCSGGLQARTDGKKLYFDTRSCDVPGQPDMRIGGSKYECETQPDGSAMCTRVNNDGRRFEERLTRLK